MKSCIIRFYDCAFHQSIFSYGSMGLFWGISGTWPGFWSQKFHWSSIYNYEVYPWIGYQIWRNLLPSNWWTKLDDSKYFIHLLSQIFSFKEAVMARVQSKKWDMEHPKNPYLQPASEWVLKNTSFKLTCMLSLRVFSIN